MNDCGYMKFKYTGGKRKKRINSNRCIALSSSNENKRFICCYFYLTLSFASYGQKKYENCELMSNTFSELTRFFSRNSRNQLFTIR